MRVGMSLHPSCGRHLCGRGGTTRRVRADRARGGPRLRQPDARRLLDRPRHRVRDRPYLGGRLGRRSAQRVG